MNMVTVFKVNNKSNFYNSKSSHVEIFVNQEMSIFQNSKILGIDLVFLITKIHPKSVRELNNKPMFLSIQFVAFVLTIKSISFHKYT